MSVVLLMLELLWCRHLSLVLQCTGKAGEILVGVARSEWWCRGFGVCIVGSAFTQACAAWLLSAMGSGPSAADPTAACAKCQRHL